MCGQISLAALLRATNYSITANQVVEEFRVTLGRADPNYTYAWELSKLINQVYGDRWRADVSSWEADVRGLPNEILKDLSGMTYNMPLVNIVSGSSSKELGGRVGTPLSANGDIIAHWVVISGISSEWNFSYADSHLNWVRIFNPFDNDTEFYLWRDFVAAWKKASPIFRRLLLEKKWQPITKHPFPIN